MLFLAVFAGFLAENQREHYVEHQREKQYIRSMIEDLGTDTSNLEGNISGLMRKSSQLDSLIRGFDEGAASYDPVWAKLFLRSYSIGFPDYIATDRTIQQLKNAGGLRLIRNKKVVSSLRQYWNQIESFYRIRDRLEMAGEKIADVSSRVFYNKFFISADDPLEPPSGIKADATLISEDAKLMAEYINRVVSKSIRTKIYLAELSEAIRTTEELIILIKQQYHLK